MLKVALALVVAVGTLVVSAPAAVAGTVYANVDFVRFEQAGTLRVTG